jgi:PTS system beta-glucosides-specific IIC component
MSLLSKFVKRKPILIAAAMAGEIKPISQSPDPVFAEKTLGDGYVVFPSDGHVYAPADGKIEALFPTGHAVGMKLNSGVEVLIHIGIDTVKLDGEGFTQHVKIGDSVEKGKLLVTVDLELITGKGLSTATPVVISDPKDKKIELIKEGNVAAGEFVLSLI